MSNVVRCKVPSYVVIEAMIQYEKHFCGIHKIQPMDMMFAFKRIVMLWCYCFSRWCVTPYLQVLFWPPLQSGCYGSLGSSYYMFELTSSPYEWKDFVYQGYLISYISRNISQGWPLSIEYLFLDLPLHALMHDFFCKCSVFGNSICHPCFEWKLKHLFYFHSLVEWSLTGLKKEEIGKLCLFPMMLVDVGNN